MKTRNFSIALVLFAFSTSNIFAQTPGTFFWSTSDLNGGATNGKFNGNFTVGDTGSLFLYYDTNGNAANNIGEGVVDLNLSFATGGVVQFTGGEVFDFGITIGQVVIQDRWSVGPGCDFPECAALQHGTVVDGGNGLDRFGSINLFGAGIISSNDGSGPFVDEGYDVGATAFLVGRIDFTAVGAGTTNLAFLADSQVVSGGVDIGFVDGGAIFVVGIPEPTSAGLLALGLIGLATRRRR